MWQSVKKRPVPDAQFPNNQPSNKHYQKPLDYFNRLAILSLFPLSFTKNTLFGENQEVLCVHIEKGHLTLAQLLEGILRRRFCQRMKLRPNRVADQRNKRAAI